MSKRETFYLHFSTIRDWQGGGVAERIPGVPRARSLKKACELLGVLDRHLDDNSEPAGYVKIVRASDGEYWDAEILQKASWGVFRCHFTGSRSEPSAAEFEEAGQLRNPQNYDPIPSRAWVACQGVVSKRRGVGVTKSRPLPVNDMTPPGPLPTAWITISSWGGKKS